MKRLIFALMVIALLVPMVAAACPPMPKVTLCHATHSDTNPFNQITVDADAVFKQGHDQHQNKEDIIPPFSYYVNEKIGVEHRHQYYTGGWTSWSAGECHSEWWAKKCDQRDVTGDVLHTYAGLNWNADGQAIWNNGCVPPPPPYTPCDEQVDGVAPKTEYGEWSAWVFDASTLIYTRTRSVTTYSVPKLDAKDSSVICVPSKPTVTTETETKKYESCEVTNEVAGPWSEWVYNPISGLMERERTVEEIDVYTQAVCDTWIEEENDIYIECSKVEEIVLNGHIEWRDVNTGKLCDSKCRDRWVQQQYGLFALEGPNGEKATMYVYADENGKLPIGVSVQRQQCVLGWVAVNTPYAGWVYKNPCTGEYKWNDQTFTPRRDVIKHGVCDRSQPCLVQ